MDKATISSEAAELQRIPEDTSSQEQIEVYTEYLLSFIQELIEKAVPMAKATGTPSPWWTPEIEKLVQEERQERRRGINGDQ